MNARNDPLRRKLSGPLVVCALVVFGFGAMVCAAAEASPAPPWKTVAASGHVEQRASITAETWHEVSRGDELAALSWVRTGRRSRATLTRSATILLVDPDSELQLPAGGPAGEPSWVMQTSGSVIYEVERRPHDKFEVVTPYLVAGVKGTVFGVTVTDRYALVGVEEGVVEVRSAFSDRVLEVHAGEAVLVDTTDAADVRAVHRTADGTRSEQRDDRRLAHRRLRQLNEAVAARHNVRERAVHGKDETVADPHARTSFFSEPLDEPVRMDLLEVDPLLALEDPLDPMLDFFDRLDPFGDTTDELEKYVRETDARISQSPTSGNN